MTTENQKRGLMFYRVPVLCVNFFLSSHNQPCHNKKRDRELGKETQRALEDNLFQRISWFCISTIDASRLPYRTDVEWFSSNVGQRNQLARKRKFHSAAKTKAAQCEPVVAAASNMLLTELPFRVGG